MSLALELLLSSSEKLIENIDKTYNIDLTKVYARPLELTIKIKTVTNFDNVDEVIGAIIM